MKLNRIPLALCLSAIVTACANVPSTPIDHYPENNSLHDARLITVASANSYHSSARGACYTYTSGGKKRYVSRSLCR